MFICMVAFAMAVLNSLKHFLMPALAPVALNVCWILGVLFLTPAFGDTLDTKIFGVAASHSDRRHDPTGNSSSCLKKRGVITFWPSLHFSHPGLKRIITLMLPIIFGLAVVQINVLMDSFIAISLCQTTRWSRTFLSCGNHNTISPGNRSRIRVVLW